MMTFSSFFSSAKVGLDVQPDGLRLVQFRTGRQGLVLEQAAFSPLPEQIFSEGKISHWDALASALSVLVQSLGLTGFPAATHLPAERVSLQRMTLPSGLKEADIEREIYAQVQRDLPGMTENLSLDFVMSPENKGAYTDLLFAIAREEYVSQYVKCINGAGLKLKIMDVDIYALTRAACFASPPSFMPGKVNALLHAANGFAVFLVFNAHDILFHQHWDMRAQTELNAQLNSALHFFHAAFADQEIAALCLCHQDQERMTEWLKACPFPVYSPSPFARIQLGSEVNKAWIEANTSDFLIACGCALREFPAW